MALGDLSLIAFAFSAGAFTFFAPCAYPLLPGYVSYYLGRSTGAAAADGGVGETGRGRAAAGTAALPATASRLIRAAGVGVLVSVGFFAVYAVLAGTVVALGARFLAGISLLELVVGGLLVVMGAGMALGWKPPTPTVRLPERRRSAAGYVGFGVLYAAAAAGCTAPVFVGVALKALSSGPAMAAATFGAYASGMAVLMVGVTVLSALGREALLSVLVRRADLVTRTAGVLLVLAGLVQIYFFLFRFDGLATLGLA